MKCALECGRGHVNKTVLIYRENREAVQYFNHFFFYEVQDQLLLSFEDGIRDEDEF